MSTSARKDTWQEKMGVYKNKVMSSLPNKKKEPASTSSTFKDKVKAAVRWTRSRVQTTIRTTRIKSSESCPGRVKTLQHRMGREGKR
ncbi:hypothetical protein BT69DRAFT_388859 [Atractiella rhizophila]|nr:hypothetical protein BT69DRAFT_388859 [Atractiella rhizophila]